MTIPKPPKKRKIKFPDPDFHQQKKKFAKQIRVVILEFYNIVPRTGNRDIFLKFLNCVNPGKIIDLTRLPYVATEPTSKKETKIACVFALISWTIQCYWNYCSGDRIIGTTISIKEIEKLLNQLQQILSDGLNQYQIQGDSANGFYLEKI